MIPLHLFMAAKSTECAWNWGCRTVQVIMIGHLFSDEHRIAIFTDDICQRTVLVMNLFIFKCHRYSTVYTRNLSPRTLLENVNIKLAFLEGTLALGTIHKSKFTMCLMILKMPQFHLVQTTYIWTLHRQRKNLSFCKIVRE